MKRRLDYDLEKRAVKPGKSVQDHDPTHALISALILCFLVNKSKETPEQPVATAEVYTFVIPHIKRLVDTDWATNKHALRTMLTSLLYLKRKGYIESADRLEEGMSTADFYLAGLTLGPRWKSLSLEDFMVDLFYRILVLSAHNEISDHCLAKVMRILNK